jgi:maltose alpha-D-glucosyltransferase/alpha-amylase
MRTRLHGDYHLGQVLWTGRDFVITDFEGEPARPLWARRMKRSPLRDVAGMVRSFHYAARHALAVLPAGAAGEDDASALEGWADLWYRRVSTAFLGSYLERAGEAAFLPRTRDELERLLKAYLLEKAIYELGYELNNRPGWVTLALQGINHALEAA